MKLEKEEIVQLQSILTAAQVIGVDDIVIEPDKIRAMDEKKTVVIFHQSDIPQFGFGSLGLTRINSFMKRVDIVKSQENFIIDTMESQDGSWVQSLLLKAKGTKIQHNCNKPEIIQVPKQIGDAMTYQLHLNAEGVMMLQKGRDAMKGNENVIIQSNSDGVCFKFSDDSGDNFTYTFADEVVNINGGKGTDFITKLPTKTLLSMFKTNTEGTIEIGGKGTLKFNVEGFDVYVLPRI